MAQEIDFCAVFCFYLNGGFYMNTSEIQINNITKTYNGTNGKEITALKNVSANINEGEFISLLGPSGCGKTTLLRVLGDLIQPTSGDVRVCGQTPKEIRMKQKYGIVFQSPVLFDWRTVRENIRLPMEIMHISKKEQDSRIEQMLGMVGLTDFIDHYPKQLSGGMQQRVGIARALVIQPDILLMDEPFSALDEFTREKLHDDLLKIWRKTNRTIIFVTHNISEAAYLSDKVFVMSPHPGRLTSIIDVDLPRPRTHEIKQSKEFFELVSKIRCSFEGGYD